MDLQVFKSVHAIGKQLAGIAKEQISEGYASAVTADSCYASADYIQDLLRISKVKIPELEQLIENLLGLARQHSLKLGE